MKKNLLPVFLFISSFLSAQVISIIPNSGFKGTTLSTTITLANGTMSMSSGPVNLNDIYFQRGTDQIQCSSYTIFQNGFSNTDSLQATFMLPLSAQTGSYDVHVNTYQCPGCPQGPIAVDNLLAGGFSILASGGTVSGNVYLDSNLNGIRDAGEPGVPNQRVRLSPSGFYALTDSSGNYSIASDTGSSVVQLFPTHYLQFSLPTTYAVTVPPDTTGIDFGVKPYPVISGTVFYDQNMNGVQDNGEHGMSNQTIHIVGGSTVFTDINGYFSIESDTGNYTVSSVAPAGYTLTTGSSAISIHLPPDATNLNFGYFTPPSIIYTHDFSIYTHPMRCTYTGFSGWTIFNTHAGVQTGNVTVIHSSNLTFTQSYVPVDSQHGDTLKWNYSIPGFAGITTSIYYQDPAAGDSVWYIIVDSIFDAGGNFQTMYADSFSFIVSCSVDPNDKSANPVGETPFHYTLKNVPIEYTIRFQNTGTDTAFNVMIADTIDPHFDINTFTVLASSDHVSVQSDGNGVLRFMFDNILLPDSNVDESGSNGYVTYRINPLLNVPDYTPVSNTGYIYFDFNSAVVTNTTTNMLVPHIPLNTESVLSKLNAFIYPNPVNNISKIILPVNARFELCIYDIFGKELIRKNISENYILDQKEFANGIYYFSLKNPAGDLYTGKFTVVK